PSAAPSGSDPDGSSPNEPGSVRSSASPRFLQSSCQLGCYVPAGRAPAAEAARLNFSGNGRERPTRGPKLLRCIFRAGVCARALAMCEGCTGNVGGPLKAGYTHISDIAEADHERHDDHDIHLSRTCATIPPG